eukprot:scaffold133403_cov64-Phaeocystis_antarctica.AAC.4
MGLPPWRDSRLKWELRSQFQPVTPCRSPFSAPQCRYVIVSQAKFCVTCAHIDSERETNTADPRRKSK